MDFLPKGLLADSIIEQDLTGYVNRAHVQRIGRSQRSITEAFLLKPDGVKVFDLFYDSLVSVDRVYHNDANVELTAGVGEDYVIDLTTGTLTINDSLSVDTLDEFIIEYIPTLFKDFELYICLEQVLKFLVIRSTAGDSQGADVLRNIISELKVYDAMVQNMPVGASVPISSRPNPLWRNEL